RYHQWETRHDVEINRQNYDDRSGFRPQFVLSTRHQSSNIHRRVSHHQRHLPSPMTHMGSTLPQSNMLSRNANEYERCRQHQAYDDRCNNGMPYPMMP